MPLLDMLRESVKIFGTKIGHGEPEIVVGMSEPIFFVNQVSLLNISDTSIYQLLKQGCWQFCKMITNKHIQSAMPILVC